MDVETLTNHISKLGKQYFDNACRIVLQDVFNLNAINVDGKNDGGTDYSSFDSSGSRIPVAYQITTQKSAIKSKAYNDAKKALKKLNIQRYYFFSTFILDEIDCRKIENEISLELSIQSVCLSSKQIAGLILNGNCLNKFLDESNYPLPRNPSINQDLREIAIHSYTLLSDDATKMKSSIYDDTILLLLSNNAYPENDLIQKVRDFLGLNEASEEVIKKRIGALFGKNKITKDIKGDIELDPNSKKELEARKAIYDIELSSLSSSQIDLLRNDFSINWSESDSKKVALWIANATITDQIKNLENIKATVINNPLLNVENGIDKIRNFLITEKKVERKIVGEVIEKLLDNASSHPLITKIARASVYLALEGSNPITSAKALGANRWSDFNILVEPTVAIPYICSQLYSGHVNNFFDLSIKALNKAKELDAKLYIPFFYINECAGHLLRARKYDGIELNEEELAYSTNAFVANYYALKNKGARLPNTFMDYLASYSSAIRTERTNVKDWVRAIMTDIQSLLVRSNVEFIDVPFYEQGDCRDFEIEYIYYLKSLNIEKKNHLLNHDVYALQFTNDKITKEGEHWIILTYDTSMIAISKSDLYKGWISNPIKFLDLTQNNNSLTETKLVSLIHSFATFSENTLAAGARIIDRIIMYAAPQMQNWEFKKEIEQFKVDLINNLDLENSDFVIQLDKKTDEFLQKHGITLNDHEEDISETL